MLHINRALALVDALGASNPWSAPKSIVATMAT